LSLCQLRKKQLNIILMFYTSVRGLKDKDVQNYINRNLALKVEDIRDYLLNIRNEAIKGLSDTEEKNIRSYMGETFTVTYVSPLIVKH